MSDWLTAAKAGIPSFSAMLAPTTLRICARTVHWMVRPVPVMGVIRWRDGGIVGYVSGLEECINACGAFPSCNLGWGLIGLAMYKDCCRSRLWS